MHTEAVCIIVKKDGKYYVFITSREGFIEQWEIYDNGKAKVDAKLVRELNIMPKPIEGVSPKIRTPPSSVT